MSSAAAVFSPSFDLPVAPPPFVMLAEPFLFVVVRYRGLPLGCHLLSAMADERSRVGRFTVGASPRAHAPVDPAFLPSDGGDHDLLIAEGAGFRLQVPAGAALIHKANADSGARALDAAELPPLVRLGEGRLFVELGAISVELARTEATSRLALARWFLTVNRDEAAAHGASFLFLLMWMLMFRFLPADMQSLSFDALDAARRRPSWTLIPAQLAETPAPGQNPQALPAADPERTSATVGSKQKQHATVRSSRIESTRRGSPTSAVEAVAEARGAGLLPMLNDENARWAAVTGRGDPFGDDAAAVLHDLRGPMVAGDALPGGLGVSGTGSRGAGTGGGLMGEGTGLATIKGGVRDGGGRDYGRMVGHLAPKRIATVDVTTCETSQGCRVAGSLDKAIIRRTIRRRINEIRYCYEQALPRKPSLGGRLVVSFAILPQGNVTAAAVAQDTLGDGAVSHCVLQAMQRMSFPQPDGGGLVTVTYPFTFAPAGATD